VMNYDPHANNLIKDLMKTIEILRRQNQELQAEISTLKCQIRERK